MLIVKAIKVRLSQACEPAIGTVARMSYTFDRYGEGFLGDIKDEEIVVPKVRRYEQDPNEEERTEIQYHSGLPDCKFLQVEVEGKASNDDA